MVRKLLVQNFLQVGTAHTVGHVTVRRVTQEVLPLSGHGGLDVLFAFDIFLRTIYNADVASTQRQKFVLQNFFGVRAFVHEIEFREDTDSSKT